MEFLESVTAIDDGHVRGLFRLLSQYGLPIPDEAARHRRFEEGYSIEEVSGIVEQMKEVETDLSELIASADAALDACPRPEGFGAIDMRTSVGEWIDYARHNLPDNSDESMELLRSQVRDQNQRLIDEYGEDGDFELLLHDDITIIVEATRFVIAHDRLSGLLEIGDRISELDLVCRAGRVDTDLNVYRQGFLLAMTAFDAAAFDLVRAILTRGFWSLIGRFPSKRKISGDDLGDFDSFEEFRDSVVDEQLRGLYLKDLLQVLKSLGVDLVCGDSQGSFGHLVELVLRRNVHVHNRGIVDTRYLPSGVGAVEQFNVDGLAVGDRAVVDRDYLDMALRLASDAVRGIAKWGERQS